MSLTVEDYVMLLAGKNTGRKHSSSHSYIKTKIKPTKEQILLAGKVGLPQNLNETYDINQKPRKTPAKKKRKLTPSLLALINERS